MPKLPEFEAGSGEITPQDRGATAYRELATVQQRTARVGAAELNSAGAAIGQGIAGFDDLVKQAKDMASSQEISKVSMQSTDFEMKARTGLNNLMAPQPDPNDPSKLVTPDPHDFEQRAGKYLESVQEERANGREAITDPAALKHYDAETARIYKGVSTQAYTMRGEMAYTAVTSDIQKTANSHAQIAFNNPETVDAQLDAFHGQMDTFIQAAPGMSAEQRVGLKTKVQAAGDKVILEQALDGMMRKGPAGREQVLELVKNGKYSDIIGDDSNTIITRVHAMAAQEAADQKAADAHQKLMVRQQQGAVVSDVLKQVAGGQHVDAQALLNNPKFENDPEGTKIALSTINEAQKFKNNQATYVDPDVSARTGMDLTSRIISDPGSPGHITDRREIDQAFGVDHTITKPVHDSLVGMLDARQKPTMVQFQKASEEFMKGHDAEIFDKAAIANNTSLGANAFILSHSPLGDQQKYAARQELKRQGDELVKQGKDPNVLLDPNSPQYFGKQLSRFTVSLADTQAYAAAHAAQQSVNQTFSNPSMDAAGKSIRTIESGSAAGNYTLVGPMTKDGDHAYGAYQVMGNNIPAWTEKWAGKRMTIQEFVNDRTAQDKVFEGQFGGYVKKYGFEGASRAWFAGEGNMNNMKASDGGTTVGHYGSWFTRLFSAHTPVGGQGPLPVPRGMGPDEAMKYFKPGQRIILPGGRIGVVPNGG